MQARFLAQQIFRQTKIGVRGRGRVFTYVTEDRDTNNLTYCGIYASEVPRAEDFDARRGNKREGERSVSTYVTDPESRNYPKYCAKYSSEVPRAEDFSSDEDWSARSRAHIFICNRRPRHEQSEVSARGSA